MKKMREARIIFTLHRPKRKMRNQSVYDRIDYSLKSEAFQEQNIIIFSDVKAPKRLVST